MLWTGAPCSHQRTPDFLSSVLAVTKLMRLSLMKAAHAAVGGAPCRKSGPWAENDGAEPLSNAFIPSPKSQPAHREMGEAFIVAL
jgi:hypothetical protein